MEQNIIGAEVQNKEKDAVAQWATEAQNRLALDIMGKQIEDKKNIREIQEGDTVSAIALAFHKKGELPSFSYKNTHVQYEAGLISQAHIDSWNQKTEKQAWKIPSSIAQKIISGKPIPLAQANVCIPGHFAWIEQGIVVIKQQIKGINMHEQKRNHAPSSYKPTAYAFNTEPKEVKTEKEPEKISNDDLRDAPVPITQNNPTAGKEKPKKSFIKIEKAELKSEKIPASLFIAEANQMVVQKIPYKWGQELSNGETGVDCSGLIIAIANKHNHNIGRPTAAMLKKQSAPIPLTKGKPGHLLFWKRKDGGQHVMIIEKNLGLNNQGKQEYAVIEARKTGTPVSKRTRIISTDNYRYTVGELPFVEPIG